jgi:1-deoxy-D-xylulose 5-phosphate reductoisomerase
VTDASGDFAPGLPRRVAVIGVTGSIGGQAVEVIERSDRLQLVGAAFFAGHIRFTDITDVIARALDNLGPTPIEELADVYAADARARDIARAGILAAAGSA